MSKINIPMEGFTLNGKKQRENNLKLTLVKYILK